MSKASRPYFTSVGLFIEDPRSRLPGSEIRYEDMPVEEAEHHLAAIGDYLLSRDGADSPLLPRPTSLQFFLHESFTDIERLSRLLRAAYDHTFVPEVTTTAEWATCDELALRTLEPMRGLINPLTILVATKPDEEPKFDRIEILLNAARNLGIQVTINCGVGPGYSFHKRLFGMEAVNARCVIVRSLLRVSESASQEDKEQFQRPGIPKRRRCLELMGFLVARGGDVYPCARLIGHQSYCMGNLYHDSVERIHENLAADAHIRALRDNGPYSLYEACSSSPGQALLRDRYYDACDFHLHALTEERLSAATMSAIRNDRSVPVGTP